MRKALSAITIVFACTGIAFASETLPAGAALPAAAYAEAESAGTDTGGRITLPLWDPPLQKPFSISVAGNQTMLGNYDVLISAYDELMEQFGGPPEKPYISKTAIGNSGVGDIPIYKYSLNPGEAKHKILLVAGTHANEKMYIWALYHFTSELLGNWESSPFLEYLRQNVQIDILPCRSPYTLANAVRKRGFRVIPETEPVAFSWVKNGDAVTLTFAVADFPDDGFLSGENYFTSAPAHALVNGTSLGVITSSDPVALPLNSYKITGVLAGNSVTIQAPDAAGDSSGTGTFQVWVDPNRNANAKGSTLWEDYTTGTSPQPADAGHSVGIHNAKGTRPLSLVENRHFIHLVEQEQYDYIMDMHAPAADNYLSYNHPEGFSIDTDKLLAESAMFVTTSSRIIDRSASASMIPSPLTAITEDHGIITHTIEWGSGLYSATAQDVTNALRWMGIVLKEVLLNLESNRHQPEQPVR